MPRMSIQFSGQSKVAGAIAVGRARFGMALKEALKEEMEVEKREVINRTPRDTGALRSSIKVTEPVKDLMSYSVSITAGDETVINEKTGKPTSSYAAIVHEDPDPYHPIGQWKYIESVIRESAPFMFKRVAGRINVRKIF